MTSQGFRPTQCDLKFHVSPGLFSEQSKHAREGTEGLMEEFAAKMGEGARESSGL